MSLTFVLLWPLILYTAEMLFGRRSVVCHKRPLRYHLLRLAQAALHALTIMSLVKLAILFGYAALQSAAESRWLVFAIAAGFIFILLVLAIGPLKRLALYSWTPLLYPHKRLWPWKKETREEEREKLRNGFALARAVLLVLGWAALLGVKLYWGRWTSVLELLVLAITAATWSYWLAAVLDERVNPRPLQIAGHPIFLFGLACVLAAVCQLGAAGSIETLVSRRPGLSTFAFFGALGMIVPLIERVMNLREFSAELTDATRAFRRIASH